MLLDLVKPITVGFTFGRYLNDRHDRKLYSINSTLEKMGNQKSYPGSNWILRAVVLFSGVPRFFNSLPLSLRNINSRVLFGKPRKIIPSDFYCSFSSF